jgi:hypothetical protein
LALALAVENQLASLPVAAIEARLRQLYRI